MRTGNTVLGEQQPTTQPPSADHITHSMLILRNPDGMLVLDRSGAILYCNPAAEALLGQPAEALTGQVFGFPIVLGEAAEIDLLTRQGTSVAEIRVVEIDWQGQHAYLAMLRNVTDRKRLEVALRASEARLTAIIENTTSHIWSIDTHYCLLVANSAFYQNMQNQLGRPITPGQTVLDDRFPPHVNTFWRSVYDRALAGESFMLELASELQHPGGVVECSLTPIRDASGLITGAVGVSRNITAHRELEAAMRASEERLRFAMEATNDGLWDWDIVTGKVVASERWFELFGYRPGEIAATIHVWEETLHPEDVAETQAILAAYLEGSAPAYRSEHRVITKSGEVRWHLSVGKVVAWDAAGRPVRMVGTNADITERKRLEHLLQQTNADLERQVAARTGN